MRSKLTIDDILYPGERERREAARLKRQQEFLEGERRLFELADAGDKDAQAAVRQRGYLGPFRSDG